MRLSSTGRQGKAKELPWGTRESQVRRWEKMHTLTQSRDAKRWWNNYIYISMCLQIYNMCKICNALENKVFAEFLSPSPPSSVPGVASRWLIGWTISDQDVPDTSKCSCLLSECVLSLLGAQKLQETLQDTCQPCVLLLARTCVRSCLVCLTCDVWKKRIHQMRTNLAAKTVQPTALCRPRLYSWHFDGVCKRRCRKRFSSLSNPWFFSFSDFSSFWMSRAFDWHKFEWPLLVDGRTCCKARDEWNDRACVSSGEPQSG